MTSSAMSSAGLLGSIKVAPSKSMPSQAEGKADGASLKDSDFEEAFKAISEFGRKVSASEESAVTDQKSLPSTPLKHPDLNAWMPIGEDVEAVPAAGDLLLAGGALTPEQDGDSTVPQPSLLDDELDPMMDLADLQSEPSDSGEATDETEEAPLPLTPEVSTNAKDAAATVVPIRPDVPTGLQQPLERRQADINKTGDTRSAEQPSTTKTDAFDGLRNLTQQVERLRETHTDMVRADAKPAGANGDEAAPARTQLEASNDRSKAVEVHSRLAIRDTAMQAPAPVTVVESRHFPGIAPALTSATTVAHAISTQESWSPMLNGALAATSGLNQTGTPIDTLKIQLRPAELGSVNAVLRLSGDQLAVELKVETIEAYRQLSESQATVLKALRSQGYVVEQISVQHVAPDRNASLSGQPASGGQDQSADNAFGQQDSGSSHSDGSGSGQDGTQWGGMDNEPTESGAANAADATRPAADGAVYL